VSRLAVCTPLNPVRLAWLATAVITHPTEPADLRADDQSGTITDDAGTMKLVRKVCKCAVGLAMESYRITQPLGAGRESSQIDRREWDTFKVGAPSGTLPWSRRLRIRAATRARYAGLASDPAQHRGILEIFRQSGERQLAAIGTVRFRSDGQGLVVRRTQERMLTLLQTARRPDNGAFCRGCHAEHLVYQVRKMFITGQGARLWW